jgi:DNA-binding NarL/FixJ family response regulator
MKIRVAIADEHQLFREGLCALMHEESDLQVVGQAGDGLAAVALARELTPDVILMKLSLPGLNGIEATRRIRLQTREVRVICRSAQDDHQQVLAAIDAGAAGCIGKGASYAELVQAIRVVMASQTYLPPALVSVLANSHRARSMPVRAASILLTPRELELVQLISEGYSTQQIAGRLHISAKTVATHRENVLNKLNLTGIAQLTRYALREGLSSLEVACNAAEHRVTRTAAVSRIRAIEGIGRERVQAVQQKRA